MKANSALGFEPDGALGVYVHVPFCDRRCAYCDFDIAVRRSIPHAPYLDALLRELALRAAEFEGMSARSFYVGGGTPSLWDPNCLDALLRRLEERFGVPEEITCEANPESFGLELAHRWKESGVNRISLGIQSLSSSLLKQLRRHHSPEQALAAVEAARRAGFEHISADLIFGLPNQRVADFERDLETLCASGIDHLSTYELTIEPQTPLWRRRARGHVVAAGEDETLVMFERLDEALPAGFHRYEVSNSAKWGGWSRHNLLYWLGGQYLGLGMGAHSLSRTRGGASVRSANGRDLKHYLSAPFPTFKEDLSPAVHLAERLFLPLRTHFSVDLDRLEAEFGKPLVESFSSALHALTKDELIEWESPRELLSTKRGRALHNALSAVIFDAVP